MHHVPARAGRASSSRAKVPKPTFDPYDASRRPGEEYAWMPVFEYGLNGPSRWRFRWVHESEIDAEASV
jgi:hypothetical protein